MSKIAFLFPGQGAQYVGMGNDFFDAFSAARDVFQAADELLSMHFSKLIFEGPSDQLTLTKNSQLAIYIVSYAIWKAVEDQFPSLKPTACAGLSLGEYTALTVARKISFEECLRLVRARALYMHEAALAHPGTMQVVLNLSPEEVQEALKGIPEAWVANINCPGQVVIAGTARALTLAAPLLKEKGAKRVLPLDVSGAFHSGLMQEAQDRLRQDVEQVGLTPSGIDFISNVPGDYVESLDKIRESLVRQVTQPVLWEQGIRALESRQMTTYYEIGPGKTLAGMNKRIGVSVPTISIEKVSDLEEIAHAIAKR